MLRDRIIQIQHCGVGTTWNLQRQDPLGRDPRKQKSGSSRWSVPATTSILELSP